ncbi:DUF6020 family protein [Mycoplasma sp. P36-A1]|uniref:DUF6020 family protein n=1 Tax=Mycoplasma sp. P36-A1 TaxID=3252900 RepID=UPI003C2D387C
MKRHHLNKDLICLILMLLSIIVIIVAYHDKYLYFSTTYFLALYYLYKINTKKKPNLANVSSKDKIFALIISLLFIFSNYAMILTLANIDKLFNNIILYLCFISITTILPLYRFIIDILHYLIKGDFDFINARNAKKLSLKLLLIMLLISFGLYSLIYPGILTSDSQWQLNQALNNEVLSNHHPIMMTLLIRLLINLGSQLGFNQLSIGMYFIFQIIIGNLIFAFVAYTLIKIKVSKKYLVFLFIVVVLNPVTYLYLCTMWKDIWLALFMMLFTILMIYYVKDNKYYNKGYFIIIFIIVCSSLSFSKNNAIYVIYLSFITCLVLLKNKRKETLIIFIIPIIIFKMITGIGYSNIGVIEGSKREMFSLPLQQMVYINKYDHGINKDLKNSLNKYINLKKSLKNYKYYLSDPVKNTFKDDYYHNHSKEFIILYLKYLKESPLNASKAFILQTFRYYTIHNNYWIVAHSSNFNKYKKFKKYDLKMEPLIRLSNKQDNMHIIKKWQILRKIPLVSDIYSVGIQIWMLMITCYIFIRKNRIIYLCISLPIFYLYLTIIASPVNGEYRYAYPYILSTLILLGFVLSKTFNEKEVDCNDRNCDSNTML